MHYPPVETVEVSWRCSGTGFSDTVGVPQGEEKESEMKTGPGSSPVRTEE